MVNIRLNQLTADLKQWKELVLIRGQRGRVMNSVRKFGNTKFPQKLKPFVVQAKEILHRRHIEPTAFL